MKSSVQLSFANGALAQYVLNSLVSEVDKQNARKKILERKEYAMTQRQRILMIAKQMTAGKLVLEGRSFHLNQDVLDQAEMRHAQKEESKREKQRKNDLNYLDICSKADDAYLRNSNCPDPTKWKNSKDILAIIRPLKEDGDKPLPTRRKHIIQRYKEWSHHSRREIGTSIIEEFSRKREKENRKKETISTNNDGNEDKKENIKEEKDVTSFEM